MPKSESTHTQSRRIGRRNFLRATAGGAAAVGTGGLGLHYETQTAKAILPAVGVAIGAGAAAGYLMRSVQDYATGDDFDSTKYQNLTDEEKRAAAREDGLAYYSADETTLTTFENLLSNAENAAFSDAKYAAVESMNLGDSETEVKAAAQDAVDSFFTTNQKNLINHSSVQVSKFHSVIQEIDIASNMSASDVFALKYTGSTGTEQTVSVTGSSTIEETVTLVDGNSLTYTALDISLSSQITGQEDNTYSSIPLEYGNTYSTMPVAQSQLQTIPEGTGSNQTILNLAAYFDVANKIESQHSTVSTEIETWVTNVYPKYTSGDISLDQLVNASDIANKAPDEQGFSYAGADLALLGISSGEHRYEIDLKTDEKIVSGTIYIKNRTNPLDLETVYSPSEISGTVWLAYQRQTSDGETNADVIALEQDFEILSGIDGEGNPVDQVTFTDSNQQTTNTDVQKIQKELQQLQDLQNKLDEQQNQIVEDSTGGGGSLLPDGQLIDGISNKVLGLGAAAVAIYGAISS